MTETKGRAERLLEILDLENLEQNLYRGENEVMPGNRLFGGQVLARSGDTIYSAFTGADEQVLGRLAVSAP